MGLPHSKTVWFDPNCATCRSALARMIAIPLVVIALLGVGIYIAGQSEQPTTNPPSEPTITQPREERKETPRIPNPVKEKP